MNQTNPTTQSWQPTTFIERGVAVAFTTPMLAGARARLGSRGVEMAMPHPAGTAGVYILNHREIANYCAATIHDLLLGERIGHLTSVAPRDIRCALRAVARDGAAGRKARHAAMAAESHDRQREARTSRLLLQLLVRQTGGGECGLSDLERHGHAALLKLAPALGRPNAAVAAEIVALAGLYAELGLDGDGDCARCRRVVAEMECLHAGLTAWAGRLGGATAQAAVVIAAAAAATLTIARPLLAQAQARAGDLPALLALSDKNAAGIMRELGRTEWLLDGWEQICLIWRIATDDGARRAAMPELLLMLPTIPTEAAGWMGGMPDATARRAAGVEIRLGEEWRATSLVSGLIARNEHIRTLAA